MARQAACVQCTSLHHVLWSLPWAVVLARLEPWELIRDPVARGCVWLMPCAHHSRGRSRASYSEVVALKKVNPKLKVILSVGGQHETNWMAVSSSEKTAQDFSKNVVAYVRLHGFDGVDLYWDRPTASTYMGFSTLVQVLRREIDKENLQPGTERLLLSADVVPLRNSIEYYTPKILAEAVDLVVIVAFYFYGPWEALLGHHSPLFLSNQDRKDPDRNFYSQKQAVDLCENAGIPAMKLVLGFAANGRSFRMSSLSLNKPGDPYTKQYSAAAPYTNVPGVYAYYEICRKGAEGWTQVLLQESRVPYVYGTDNGTGELVWVGYDNLQSFTEKALFVVQRGLAGAMMWELSFDDFAGTHCEQGAYPLLKAINDIFEKAKCAVDSDCQDVLTGGVCVLEECTCQYARTVTAENNYTCVTECAVDSDCQDVLTGGGCVLGVCTCQYARTVTAENNYTCVTECPGRTYGRYCNTSCGHCADAVICDIVTGRCPGACDPGYLGERCDEVPFLSTSGDYKTETVTSSNENESQNVGQLAGPIIGGLLGAGAVIGLSVLLAAFIRRSRARSTRSRDNIKNTDKVEVNDPSPPQIVQANHEMPSYDTLSPESIYDAISSYENQDDVYTTPNQL